MKNKPLGQMNTNIQYARENIRNKESKFCNQHEEGWYQDI